VRIQAVKEERDNRIDRVTEEEHRGKDVA